MASNELDIATILLTFGGLFIIGLIADLIGRHSPLPRVTLLIITGFLIGPSVLNWLPEFTQQWFPLLTDIALAMIGFLLGQSLTKKKLSSMGRPIMTISISVMLMTSLLMFFGLILLGAPLELALVLAAIAPATAPAPVVDVTQQLNAKGPLTDTLLGIVAVDDAWGLLLFSLLLVSASFLASTEPTLFDLYYGLWELGGAIILGIVIGVPMSYINSHIYPGKSTQAEVLGLVLLCAGLAELLGVSYILAAMVMGTVVANLAKNHRHRAFTELERFEWPLLILFFLLAGASLQLEALLVTGLFGLAYIILRIAGRLSGSYIGATWANCQSRNYHYIGLAMLPHAGIPIGMALVATKQFPEHESTILAVILGATVIFELMGPPITRFMLERSGETHPMPDRDSLP